MCPGRGEEPAGDVALVGDQRDQLGLVLWTDDHPAVGPIGVQRQEIGEATGG
jgi:hypothetical protein